jgi:hypothetical protein
MLSQEGRQQIVTNTQAFAERIARADQAFTRHVVDKVPLSQLGPELGVSYETARADVQTFRQYLASDRTTDLEEKRAAFLAQVDASIARCLYLYEAYKDKKPLAAVGALNTLNALLAQVRAVEGLDAPKQLKAEQDITYRVVWDEGDEAPAPDPSHADPQFTTS